MRRALKYTSNAKVFGPLIHVLSLFIDQIRHDLPGNTLLDHGVLKLMVEQWCVLRNVPVGIVDPSRSLSIGILKILDTPPGYPWIAEALTAGLLRGIILHARNANIIEDLKGLIGVVLSRSTVYYSVLSVLGSSLFAVADEMKSEHFLGSELIGEWGQFVQLVTERLEVVKMYDSDTYFSSQGCDYTKCCVIGEKRRFKCCSACQKVYYCSSACQKKDWRNGGHRNRCEGIRTFRPANPDNLSKRNMSFLRALVHYDYQKNREKILGDRMTLMSVRDESYIVTFSYVHLNGRLELNTSLAADIGKGISPASWDGYIKSRAQEPRSRVDLHLILTWEGRDTHARLIPMRSSTPAVYDGLKTLMRKIPPGTPISELQQRFPVLYRKFQAVLNTKVVEIH
ncbi:hypothetical protein C8J57DRAFT_1364094 [Mycena rebaudengoi]|nr:hypothetical protein C8J57DRAFT_1364094 [Mycena rebaudengoi]